MRKTSTLRHRRARLARACLAARGATVELLEHRTMFTAGPVASYDLELRPVADPGDASPAFPASPYTAAQIRHFYGLDSVSFGGTAGSGAGQTIVLIDSYNCSSVTSDLATFDSDCGLAPPPSLVIENQNGNTSSASLPTTYNQSAAQETSLDVEWAHAMAPGANIVVVDCNSLSSSDVLLAGVPTANKVPGVSVVAMSFGFLEFSGENSYDKYFNQSGVTYLASTGDNGSAQTAYPAFSPNVVGVGGTEITFSSNGSYGSETVWNDPPPSSPTNFAGATGGSVSSFEIRPVYQNSDGLGYFNRTVPDVAFEASVDSGVLLIAQGVEYYGGGTSLSAPCWAGIIAVTDQGRALAGESSLTGSTQTLPKLYSLPSSDFHDITTGNNNYNGSGGYTASAGFDVPSGLGTPNAPSLISDLAGFATVTGQVFQDNSGTGVFGGTDTGLAGLTVYLDENNNGVHDSNEPTAVTNASGGFLFTDVPSGVTGSVRLLTAPAGYVQVANASYTGTTAATSTANIALFPTAFTTAAANAAYTVQVSPTQSTQLQILVNGTVTYTAPVTLPPTLSFTFTGTGDSLAVDFGNGNPLEGALAFNGSAASNGDTLAVLGTTGNDTITANTGAVIFGTATINYSNVPNVLINPRTGTDALTVNAGAVTIPAQNAGGGILSRSFSTLAVASGARLAVGTAASRSDRTVLQVSTLSVSGTGQLDLGANDMVVTGSTLAAVDTLVTTGDANGQWTGPGITSSAAAPDTTHLTALGVVQNNQSGTPLYAGTKTFDLIANLPASAILVKYTLIGDANLDGKVDGSDYALIDAGYAGHGTQTGWYHGDFNYDGSVDGTDYSLIDNAFNNQINAYPSAIVAAIAAAPAVQAAPAAAVAVQSRTSAAKADCGDPAAAAVFSTWPVADGTDPHRIRRQTRRV